MENTYDVGKHYGNVSFKQFLWTSLNTNSQNKSARFTFLMLLCGEIISFGQFYGCRMGYKYEIFGVD